MPESTESKLTEKRRAVFAPQTMGLFVLLLIILSFIAGTVRQELSLMLTGAVFLAVWVYCLVMTLLAALIHRRRTGRILIRVSPQRLAAGERAAVLYSEGDAISHNIFRLPGILIRCRVLLATGDGRRIRHDFMPRQNSQAQAETFEVKMRGAYFSAYDEFAVFDAPGFFRFAYRIPQGAGARLLASPGAADEPVPVNARSGESNQKPELSFQRSGNLIDHRPYIPGDDPRRINWKLYSHGGELFVRENEREPPPHSSIAILIDSQYDPLLYTHDAARRGVDLLCENALSAALSAPFGGDSGMDVLIGCTCAAGNTAGFAGGQSAAELAAALAWPAALPLSSPAELPAPPESRGILIFALPRAAAEFSALDRFLREHENRAAGRTTAPTAEIIFLVSSGGESGGAIAYSERLAAAETCAVLYSRRPGVKARALGV